MREKNNPANDYDCAHMYIANPLKKGSFLSSLFSTHPPMEERIARLNRLADKMGL
jgi:heat shock protein HtpX